MNEVAEAPNDGRQYARKNKAWAEVQVSDGTVPETVMKFRGEFVYGTTYAKNDVVTYTTGAYTTNMFRLRITTPRITPTRASGRV